MAKLDNYLERKAAVLAERRADFTAKPEAALVKLKATAHVAGNTGVRPVRMGDYIVISDSAPGLAGHSLGPTAPEMLLGALASCLVHTYLLQAALLDIPLDSVERFKAEQPKVPVYLYDAGHGFFTKAGMAYDEKAMKESLKRTLDLFEANA